ncbi:MAG: hypothetical protein C0425_02410 [Chlorobiaceae bacterium]|nr:hypothetical protein [Chlorobiaceae bacterium]MBA4309173.1 hypothetical protein [Chlorobiaceae bacterium]
MILITIYFPKLKFFFLIIYSKRFLKNDNSLLIKESIIFPVILQSVCFQYSRTNRNLKNPRSQNANKISCFLIENEQFLPYLRIILIYNYNLVIKRNLFCGTIFALKNRLL